MLLLRSVLLASCALAVATAHPSYACWPGQGQGWISYNAGPQNSFEACAKRCNADVHCFGFDYTNRSKSDACRLYPPNNPKLYDAGWDHRAYCAKSEEPDSQPADKACPRTKQEEDIATYVALRAKSFADGSIKKQIQKGLYTVDSLSLEMYTWWVQLGLASHGEAIDNFVTMLQDAGMEQQQVPSKNWGPIISGWIFPMLMIANILLPSVMPAFFIIQTGLLSYQTIAMAMADPDQGGSTDFLKAAMRWRASLPDRTTNHLLMIHNFTNAIRDNYSDDMLLEAYDAVTKLINGTQSFRHVLNAYYVTYLNSATNASNGIHPVVNVKQKIIGGPLEVESGVLWPAAPWKLKGCVMADALMRENNECIDSNTPVLGELWYQPLLFFSSVHTAAFAYSCNSLGLDDYTGCWDTKLAYHTDRSTCSGILESWRSLALGSEGMTRVEHLCKSTLNASTNIISGSQGSSP